MDPAWIVAATALGGTVVGIAAWCARWAWKLIKRTMLFLDDYFGEAARPGVKARPGVMARLQSVEESIAAVLAETQPNGGSSMRDDLSGKLRALHTAVSGIKQDQAAMRTRIELFETQREGRAQHDRDH